MTMGLRTIIFPVKDLDAAKAVFGALLGVAPSSDSPYYVGFDADGQQVGLDPNGHGKGMTGPVGYWHVDDIEGTLARLLDAGAELQQEISDVGGGRRIAVVKDADGNPVGILQDP